VHVMIASRRGCRSRSSTAWSAIAGAASRRSPPAALERVADDRMTDAREVRADLMRAAGLEHELEQRVIARVLDPRVVRDSASTALLDRNHGAAVVTRQDRGRVVMRWWRASAATRPCTTAR